MFRVKIKDRKSDYHFEAYFNDLPTSSDICAEIKKEAKVVDLHHTLLYSRFLIAAQKYEWPETWSRHMDETGKHASEDMYIRIKKFSVVNNSPQ